MLNNCEITQTKFIILAEHFLNQIRTPLVETLKIELKHARAAILRLQILFKSIEITLF